VSDNIESTNVEKTIFEYKVVEKQGHKVLVLSGFLDLHTAHQFMQAVMSILDEKIDHMVMDMNGVNYVDSSGLGVFITALKRVSPSGKTVNLVGCNPRITRMFYVNHLSSFMVLYENMDDAIKALSA